MLSMLIPRQISGVTGGRRLFTLDNNFTSRSNNLLRQIEDCQSSRN